MRVNSACKAIVMLAILFITSSFTDDRDRDVRAKQVNLMIRQLGHRLLLQAGDSTSGVSPVTETKEGTFRLMFENEVSFNHDSLVVLSQNLLPKKQFPSGYTVTVHDYMRSDIVYGFELNSTSPDIIACIGRDQPTGCYAIEIVFPDLSGTTADLAGGSYSLLNLVFSGVLVSLAVALLSVRLGKKTKPVSANSELPSLGKFSYNVKDRCLLLNGDVISLTDKECRILELLNENFGELIPRETLMKKIWIDEGVITGRSLDMFVSKLRKKLSRDENLRIMNVHGKGYKLTKT